MYSIKMFKNCGLVLEGGGMRGVFTAGVLDAFLDGGLDFPYIIGVSAGASNGLSYASKQRQRAKKSNIDMLEKYRYISYWRLLLRGEVMNFDLLFNDFPNKILPYDYPAYERFCEQGRRFTIVASDCLTGKPVYFSTPSTRDDLLLACRASCSMPIATKICYVNNVPMLDGGICDPIPVDKARSDGMDKIVAILTRNIGYRKGEFILPPWSYRRYPEMRRALREKSSLYNAEIESLERDEKLGRVLVIRPTSQLEIDRLGRDISKLRRLYEHGLECGRQALPKIGQYLSFSALRD